MTVPLETPEPASARRREAAYNAELVAVMPVHDDLIILRVRPDGPPPRFEAGQYTTLGLGSWEPTIPGTGRETPGAAGGRMLIKRAYSVSCSLLDASGKLVRVGDAPYLEFYVALVRRAEVHGPTLTPHLFALAPGCRLFVGPRFAGHYTLAQVRPEDDVLLFATGTGEAPHNAMLAELLACGHRGRIAAITCVRRRRDLAYLAAHRELERRHANYRYLPLTTREPENVDAAAPGYVGKTYVQEYVAGGRCEADLGYTIDPGRTHAYLCGNPAMIGGPRAAAPHRAAGDTPRGMVDVLAARGFRLDEPRQPGNIHFERYW